MNAAGSRSTMSRRAFIGSAGLTVAFTIVPRGARGAAAAATFAPNAFVRITPDNVVTVVSKHLEMGSGAYTGLATILAEELDADWKQVRVESAPLNKALYANLHYNMQVSGGSSAIANSYDQLRRAGASARAMLVGAAAIEWKAPASEITVSRGVLAHPASGRSATFGQMAEHAARVAPPAEVVLKDPKTFRLIGADVPRVDTASKCDGTALYTLDVKLPGMLTAVVAHPPRFGAVVKSVDDTAARKVPGVKFVVPFDVGVGVVADNYRSALKGRDALVVAWDESKAEMRSDAEIMASYRSRAGKPGFVVRNEGDVAAAEKRAAQVLTAEFEFPYLAHATMEPMNCVIRRSEAGAELWYACQSQFADGPAVARVLGIPEDQVKINTLMAGGSFGRRGDTQSGYVIEATQIAKRLPVGTPLKMIWTREDDMRAGCYRPLFFHKLAASLDREGNLVGWRHRLVGQSLLKGTTVEHMMRNGFDGFSVEGGANLPYATPNIMVDLHTPEDVGVRVMFWRSVGHSHNAFATEVFMDRVAKAANQDPVAFRRRLLAHKPRHLAVLNLAAEKAGWGTPLPKNRARGVAVLESYHSFVAQVVEITRDVEGRISVDRVVCAVDCGVPINPSVIQAQMDGGILFGLDAILNGAITLKEGVVEQGNFDTYKVLHMAEAPAVEVHVVPSTAEPTGVGETSVSVVGPALANAVFALTGKTVSRLPMGDLLKA